MTETAEKVIKQNKKWEILNNNQLKIIALIAMTVDHIGYELMPEVSAFRYIGRLAFPIFAYMIAEGCKYTKNRKKYIGVIAAEAFLCQAVYFIAERSFYMNIFFTFALGIALIFAVEAALKKRDFKSCWVAALCIVAVLFITLCMPRIVDGFQIDYGLIGVLIPVVIYFCGSKILKLAFLTVMLLLLGHTTGQIQYFAVFAVPLLCLYNGERGKLRLKYFFYAYYPAHLAVIYLISLVM